MNKGRLVIAFRSTLLGLPLACCIALAPAGSLSETQTTVARAMEGIARDTDPFLWLEKAASPQALAWVNAQNAKTAAVLEDDQNFKTFYAEALKIAESKTRIPYPQTIGKDIYNFWQDKTHIRGILRRTSPASYVGASPVWMLTSRVRA
jgi:prolyl oligopeptidase